MIPIHALAEENPIGQYDDTDYATLFAAAAKSDGAYSTCFGNLLGERILEEPLELICALALKTPEEQRKVIPLVVMNDTLYFEGINTVEYFHALQLPQDATDAEQEVLETMIDFVHLYYGEPVSDTGDPILSVFTLMAHSGSAALWLNLRRRTQYT